MQGIRYLTASRALISTDLSKHCLGGLQSTPVWLPPVTRQKNLYPLVDFWGCRITKFVAKLAYLVLQSL